MARRIWIVAAPTPVITPRTVYGGTPYDSVGVWCVVQRCTSITSTAARSTQSRWQRQPTSGSAADANTMSKTRCAGSQSVWSVRSKLMALNNRANSKASYEYWSDPGGCRRSR